MDDNQQIGDDRQPAEAVAGEVFAGLFSAAGRADPYPLYDRLRPFGAAVTTSDGMLLVSGYAAMAALLRDHRLVKAPERTLAAAGYPDWQDRPALRLMFTSLLMLNPPAHTRLRRLVSGVFTGRRVELLRPAVEKIVEDGLDALDGAPDFVDAFAFPLPVNVIGELLGVPASDRPMFQGLARDWAWPAEAALRGPGRLTRRTAEPWPANAGHGGALAELGPGRLAGLARQSRRSTVTVVAQGARGPPLLARGARGPVPVMARGAQGPVPVMAVWPAGAHLLTVWATRLTPDCSHWLAGAIQRRPSPPGASRPSREPQAPHWLDLGSYTRRPSRSRVTLGWLRAA